jgi:hypothetical protein
VEILGSAHVRFAHYDVIFIYCGIAVAAATVLLYLHARVNGVVLLVISSYDKDPWQASA